MTNDHANHDLKKPGALLVFLSLSSSLGKYMQRRDIVSFVKERYGVEINERTVTQSTNFIGSLSDKGSIPFFLQCAGKKGYCLRLKDGPITLGEALVVTSALNGLSPESGKSVLSALSPLLSLEDAEALRSLSGRYLWGEYLQRAERFFRAEKMEMVLDAMRERREISFSHTFRDALDNEIQERRLVAMSPYRLFAKGGQIYVFGGKIGDGKGDRESYLYVASLDSMEDASLTGNDAIPEGDFERNGVSFDVIGAYVRRVPVIVEGQFPPSVYGKAYSIRIHDEGVVPLIKARFGDCLVRKSKKASAIAGIPYDLYADLGTTMSIALSFPTQISLRFRDLSEFEQEAFRKRLYLIDWRFKDARSEEDNYGMHHVRQEEALLPGEDFGMKRKQKKDI